MQRAGRSSTRRISANTRFFFIPSWSCTIIASSPPQSVWPPQISTISYRQSPGTRMQTIRLPKISAVKRRISSRGANRLISFFRPVEIVSSTAVIAHFVGTNFLRLPRSPAVISFEIWYTSISDSPSAMQASVATISVSDVILSTTRATFAFPRRSSFRTGEADRRNGTVERQVECNRLFKRDLDLERVCGEGDLLQAAGHAGERGAPVDGACPEIHEIADPKIPGEPFGGDRRGLFPCIRHSASWQSGVIPREARKKRSRITMVRGFFQPGYNPSPTWYHGQTSPGHPAGRVRQPSTRYRTGTRTRGR